SGASRATSVNPAPSSRPAAVPTAWYGDGESSMNRQSSSATVRSGGAAMARCWHARLATQPPAWPGWPTVPTTPPAPTTVVVVHRDRPRLLAASLEAWAAQTVPVRILLVDSGSTEEDHRAALALLPAGADVVRMGRNGGFGPSANAGWRRFLAEQDGEWVGL